MLKYVVLCLQGPQEPPYNVKYATLQQSQLIIIMTTAIIIMGDKN